MPQVTVDEIIGTGLVRDEKLSNKKLALKILEECVIFSPNRF
ncbi:hypothetical protein [Thermotoga profunda]|nr:hypothetical protein [Thermotoga profunda]